MKGRRHTPEQVIRKLAEGEVDFGQVRFFLGGEAVEGWMFVMRLSASGKGFHRVYLNQAQEVFLDGYVAAFAHFGGVPRRIRYEPETRRGPGDEGKGPDRDGPVHRHAQPLRLRVLLLPARAEGCPREGRRGG